MFGLAPASSSSRATSGSLLINARSSGVVPVLSSGSLNRPPWLLGRRMLSWGLVSTPAASSNLIISSADIGGPLSTAAATGAPRPPAPTGPPCPPRAPPWPAPPRPCPACAPAAAGAG
jgi:hypothetical protein